MATVAKKPAAIRKPAARKSPARAKDGTFAKKSNGHWGTAAIVGGVAAVGAAATATLFALRRNSLIDFVSLLRRGDDAHQADKSARSERIGA
jgi:hypothetical protein